MMVIDRRAAKPIGHRSSTSRSASAVVVSIVSLILLMSVGACGEASDSLEPEAYFASVSDAVVQYAADLDAVDQDLLAGDWILPPPENRKEVDEFFFTAETQVRAGHLDAWKSFIAALESLTPPEGIEQLGEGFEDGFPEYIEEGVIAAESAAYEANAEYQRHREDYLAWFAEWDPDVDGNDEYRDRGMKGDELLSLADSAEDVLEDEWEKLEGFADEAGFEFDGADLRTELAPGSNLKISRRFTNSVTELVDNLQA